ncbi:MAG TPA: hypothetical protein VKQ31_12405 [Steroidobacteraceae bacterium]|nr:hypothetical protein [Steroidobacteraceae bacterium]
MAQTVSTEDPLHAFCYGTSACSDNGVVTPTTTNPPQFGFTISPGPQTGDYLIDVLVPNNDPQPVTYTITGSQGGPLDNSGISSTATEFSTTAWTSGDLGNYLGIPTASPTNPLSNWLGYTQAHDDPGATGYFVYQADLGKTLVQPNGTALAGPLLNIGALQPGTVITSFLNAGTPRQPNWIATASSGGLYIHKVPESGVLTLLAAGLLGVCLSYRTRRRALAG